MSTPWPKHRCKPRAARAPARWAGAALLMSLGLGQHSAQAARPMITDDARIVDAKSCQLESWVRRNPQGDERWALPGCNPSGHLEITAGGARLADGQADSLGLLQGKTLFQTLEDSRLAWGLALGVTRTPALGATEAYGYLPATWAAVPNRVYVHLNLGARRDTVRHTVQPTWGLGLETVLTPRMGVIAEAFGQERGRSQYQGGLRIWLVPDRVQIDTTVGNRTGQAPGQGAERWFSVGVRLLSPAFLP